MNENPEIVCHLEKKLSYTAFDCLWIPSSARFVSLGCDTHNIGFLGVYELSRGAIDVLREVENPFALRCATFGATTLENRHLTTGDFRGNLHIWDLERLDSPLSSFEAHEEIVNSVDGVGGAGGGGGSKEIVTGSRDGFVRIWDPRQSPAVTSIGPKEGEAKRDCWSVAFGHTHSLKDRVVAAGYENGDLKLFDLRKKGLLWETNLKSGICSLEFNEKGNISKNLVASTVDAKVFVNDLDSADVTPYCESAHKSTVWSVSHLSQNPDVFMTTGGNGSLNLWKHNDGRTKKSTGVKAKRMELMNTSSISKEAICNFDWHPDKTGLGIAASFDQIVRIIIVTRLTESEV